MLQTYRSTYKTNHYVEPKNKNASLNCNSIKQTGFHGVKSSINLHAQLFTQLFCRVCLREGIWLDDKSTPASDGQIALPRK